MPTPDVARTRGRESEVLNETAMGTPSIFFLLHVVPRASSQVVVMPVWLDPDREEFFSSII